MDNIMMMIIKNFLFRSFHSNKTNINNIRVRVPSRGEGRGEGRGEEGIEKKREKPFFLSSFVFLLVLIMKVFMHKMQLLEVRGV